MELLDADAQIRIVEFVRNIPANRTKRATLLHKCVEETQSKQHLLPLRLHSRVHAAKELRVRNRVRDVGTQEISPDTSRSLVCNLDTIFKNTDWELRGWIRRKPESELFVHRCWTEFLADLLERR